MGKMRALIAVLSCLAIADCGVLLWSPTRLRIPALRTFRREDFDAILNKLDEPNVISFNVEHEKITKVLPRKLGNLLSAYAPKNGFQLEDSQDLGDDLIENTDTIESAIKEYNSTNVLVVIFSYYNNRVKREDLEITTTEEPTSTEPAKTTTTTTTTTTEKPILSDHKGSVVYMGNDTIIIYSSQAPKLRINSTSLFLGPATHTLTDYSKRPGSVTIRLINTIGVKGGKKFILRFKFTVSRGYWSLPSVEVEENKDSEIKTYNLMITKDVGAENTFSYHCHKDTVFKDSTGDVELVLYKIQVQPDAKKGRFSDAYNCVHFMTGPIWSGILVTASLIVGFFIALAALGDIKTMDKFDNYRTKQLNITVSE